MRIFPLPVALLLLAVLASPDPSPSFESAVRPLLEESCLGCHSGRRPKGGLDLEAFAEDAPRDLVARVARRIARGEMPPAGNEAPPPEAERAALAWMRTRLPPDESARARRLNRAEYRNTIRDLLGVDYDTDTNFPADDVGAGFDNNADVLSLPPILLEKYLAAAESIAARALPDEDPEHPPCESIAAERLAMEGGGRLMQGRVWLLYSAGTVQGEFRFPRDGVYLLRARAWAQQAGPEKAKLGFAVDRQPVGAVEIEAVADAPRIVEVRVRVKAGRRRVGASFLNDYYAPDDPDPKNRDRNLAIEEIEVAGPVDRVLLPAAVGRALEDAHGDLGRAVQGLARRIFRRPPAPEQVRALLDAAAGAAGEGGGFARTLRLALVAMLVSPRFLFRIPEGDDFDLASRLSYFLWSSTPDEELLDLAAKGGLSFPEVVDAQVVRLLRDPRASALSENFAPQWLRIRGLEGHLPDARLFPEVDRPLLDSMLAETVLLFDAVLREQRSVRELLDPGFTFVDERLARHYGMEGVTGDRMRRVPLVDPRRRGVLTHASVLLATSNPTRTSPVKRGKWILEALLDAPPPPPPPGVGTLDESAAAAASAPFRERLAAHRSKADCAACHARMDAMGFCLEHFDAVGRWREEEGRFPIVAEGELPDGSMVRGSGGLAMLLEHDDAFLRALARQLLVYGLGRGLDLDDEVRVREVVREWKRGPLTLERLILALVRLPSFRMAGA